MNINSHLFEIMQFCFFCMQFFSFNTYQFCWNLIFYTTTTTKNLFFSCSVISPVLHTLHWLPVEQRIEYRLLLLAFKSVNNDGPSYLSDLKFYNPSRQLRSFSDFRPLRIPSFRLKSFGQSKFSYQASVLWDSLPISLRRSNSTSACRSTLKTHLFPSQ